MSERDFAMHKEPSELTFFPELDLLPMYFKAKKDPTQRRPVVARFFCNFFNVSLRREVQRFQKTNSDSRVSLISTGDIFTDAVMNPKAYGAKDNECIDKGGDECVGRPRPRYDTELTFGTSCGGTGLIRQWLYTRPSPKGLRRLLGDGVSICFRDR